MVSLIVNYPFFYDIPKYIRDSSILEKQLQKGPSLSTFCCSRKTDPPLVEELASKSTPFSVG